MTIEIYLLLGTVQTVLAFTVALLSFIRYRSRSLTVRLVGFIFLASCTANILAWLLVKTQTYRAFTNIPSPVSAMISLCLYSWLYFVLLRKKKPIIFILISSAFVLFGLINIFFIQKTARNSYTLFLYTVIMLTYALSYFYTLMKDLPSVHIHKLPMFWFNSGLLIYHAGVFFLFAFTSYLVNVMKNNLLTYYSFHNMLAIVELIIFITGMTYDLSSLRLKSSTEVER